MRDDSIANKHTDGGSYSSSQRPTNCCTDVSTVTSTYCGTYGGTHSAPLQCWYSLLLA